jgi:hypothetical protein
MILGSGLPIIFLFDENIGGVMERRHLILKQAYTPNHYFPEAHRIHRSIVPCKLKQSFSKILLATCIDLTAKQNSAACARY